MRRHYCGGKDREGRQGIGDFVITEGEASSCAHVKHVEQVFWTHRASLVETRVTLHAASSSFVVSVGIVVGSLLVIAKRLWTGAGVVSAREIACYPYEPGACCELHATFGGGSTWYASLISLNCFSANSLRSGFLSGCHFSACFLYLRCGRFGGLSAAAGRGRAATEAWRRLARTVNSRFFDGLLVRALFHAQHFVVAPRHSPPCRTPVVFVGQEHSESGS